MPNIIKLGRNYIHCISSYDAKRLSNIVLGKNARVHTNSLLMKNPRLNQFINNETMGALDNYAAHENMDIFITPLENDMFNDLKVSVFKKGHHDVLFPMNIKETKEGVREFFRELYTQIHNATHTAEEPKPAIPQPQRSKLEDLKTYAENVIERYNNARMSILNKFQ